MSFDVRFRPRWEGVIAPGIRSVRVNDRPLEACRVDAGLVSDSILTRILSAISTSRLVLADITTLGHVNGRAVRNGNVMYEVGIAHAVRLPEEVLLFRSDADGIPFDVANVRVNSYDPDGDPDGARKRVSDAIVEAGNEIDLRRHSVVRDAVRSLDVTSRMALLSACVDGYIRHYPTCTVAQALGNSALNASIRELLKVGALVADGQRLSAEVVKDLQDVRDFVRYVPTPLGHSMCTHMKEEMTGGVIDDGLIRALQERLEGADG